MTEAPLILSPGPAGPTRPERLALRVLQLGAIAVVLAVTTDRAFDLDRFFVPKELVLHLTALLAGLLAFAAIRRAGVARADRLLAAYVGLSAVSALFATNHWLGFRALAVSASSVLLFRIARGLRDAGLARPLLNGLALAVVVAALTSLLQAYGVDLEVFSRSRAPGGTLGNRNFIAHAAAFGLPLLLLAAFRARRASSSFVASAGVLLVTASLVLTRSRAAWLAFGAVVLVFLGALLLSPPLRRDGRTWRRLFAMVVFAGCGVAMAVLLPNTLKWRSDNPYLESVKRVADYQEGSGHGRLVQYRRSLVLAAHHPLLGAGPGNWAVVYPAHAVRNDPSMNDAEPGMTFNPWPSSDWVASIAERGLAATVLLALALLGILLAAFRQLRRALDVEEGLAAAALLGTLAGAGVAGAFDAVLLLAVPALLVWTAAGALLPSSSPESPAAPRWLPFLLVLLAALGAVRSAAQLVAMQIYATSGDRAALTRASSIDPGNYRLQLRLARIGPRKERCRHALAARDLFPNAAAAKAVARPCE